MKKIVKLTESDLIHIVKNVIVESNARYRRRFREIEKHLDDAIIDAADEKYEPEGYKDYKEEIQWKTLGGFEEEFGEQDNKELDSFFEVFNTFNSKIRKGYANHMKMLSEPEPPYYSDEEDDEL